MLLGTVEIQGVARFDVVVLDVVEPHVELAAQDEERFLPVMSVCATASSSRGDVEDVDLEHRVGKRDQVLHLDTVETAQPAALRGAHQLRASSTGRSCTEELEQRAAVCRSDALQQRNRRLRKATFHKAEIRRRDPRAFSGRAQRQASSGPCGAQSLADHGIFGHGLACDERMQRRWRKATREQRADVAQTGDVLRRVPAMAASGAHRAYQPLALPRSERRRADANSPGDLADPNVVHADTPRHDGVQAAGTLSDPVELVTVE